jgi:hypothetical protein
MAEHPSKVPKANLRRFLRNWVSNAVNRYGVGQPRIIGYETITTFVPVDDSEGEEEKDFAAAAL